MSKPVKFVFDRKCQQNPYKGFDIDTCQQNPI